MQIIVKCGDPDCREEFKVMSEEPVWECPSCGRKIENKNYPFLTAKLMQARIDGDENNWRVTFQDLLENARIEVEKRTMEKKFNVDLSFLEKAKAELSASHSNREWRDLHDDLLKKGREVVMELDRKMH